MEKTFALIELKQFALNTQILNSIQIAAIQAASQIKLDESSQNLKNLISNILNKPEDTTWCKAVSFYVVVNNTDLEWDKFQEKIKDIEAVLVEKCIKAIASIGA